MTSNDDRGAVTTAPSRLAHPYAFAALSGLLYYLSFPTKEHRWWALAWVAYVPLYFAVRSAPAKQSFLLGLVAGFTMNLLGFWWLIRVLTEQGQLPFGVNYLAYFLLCVAHGIRVAIHTSVSSVLSRYPIAPPWRFSLGFVIAEAWVPAAFRWRFAASLIECPSVAQLADLGGPVLVGLIVVLISSVFSEALYQRLSKNTSSRTLSIRYVAIGIAILLSSTVYGLVRLQQIASDNEKAKSIRVGLLQSNVDPFQEQPDTIESALETLNNELQESHVDLEVWPEAILPFSLPSSLLPAFAQQYYQQGPSMIIGAVTIDEANKQYNSAIAIDHGTVKGIYNKRVLLPFSEYFPLSELFPSLAVLSPATGRFSSGESPAFMTVSGVNIVANICYEDVLSSHIYQLASAGPSPQLLVNLTNDGWFGDTSEPWIHLDHARYRAIEYRIPMIRATNTGVTAVIGANGAVEKSLPVYSRSTMVADVKLAKRWTLYSVWGEWPVDIAATLIAILTVFALKRRL